MRTWAPSSSARSPPRPTTSPATAPPPPPSWPRAMIREGLKNLAAGANPMVMRRGIQKAAEAAVAEIRANSQPVSGSQDIARVGTISSGDEAHRPAS